MKQIQEEPDGKIQGDKEIQSINEAIMSGEAQKSLAEKYRVQDGLMSGKDEDLKLWLYV